MRNYFAATGRFVRELLGPTYPQREEHLGRDRPFLIFGHRGSPCVLPENTLTSFDLALEEGANALELDLCITKDGQVVCWHDWTPHQTTFFARWLEFEPHVKYYPLLPSDKEYWVPVCDLPLDDFRRVYGYKEKRSDKRTDDPIPTFREFMAWASTQTRLRALSLDLKIPNERSDLVHPFMRAINEVIAEYGEGLEIMIEVTEAGVLKNVLEENHGYDISFDTEASPGFVLFPDTFSSVQRANDYGLSAAVPLRPRPITVAPWTTYRRLIDHEQALRRSAAGQQRESVRYLIAATINSPKEMECLIRMGVDGIQTDLPAELRAVAERLRVPL